MNEIDKQHEAWLRGRAREVVGGWSVLAMITHSHRQRQGYQAPGLVGALPPQSKVVRKGQGCFSEFVKVLMSDKIENGFAGVIESVLGL
jgi:hypothetical protein